MSPRGGSRLHMRKPAKGQDPSKCPFVLKTGLVDDRCLDLEYRMVMGCNECAVLAGWKKRRDELFVFTGHASKVEK